MSYAEHMAASRDCLTRAEGFFGEAATMIEKDTASPDPERARALTLTVQVHDAWVAKAQVHATLAVAAVLDRIDATVSRVGPL